jgi:hypothetical protein
MFSLDELAEREGGALLRLLALAFVLGALLFYLVFRYVG